MKENPTCNQMLNASNNGVITTDANGCIVFVNQQAKKIIKTNSKKTLGAFFPDILPMTGALVLKCLKTGVPQPGRQIIGGDLKLMVNITPIKNNGQIIGAMSSFQEMQQFELTAMELESYKQLNKQLNTIFKSSSDGIWVSDYEGRILNINEASEKLNGIRAKDVIGKNVAEILSMELFDRSVSLEVLETKRQVSFVQYIKKTKKHLLVTGTPTFDDKGNIVLVVVNERDMTQLNEIMEQLEETRLVTEKYIDELAELSVLELKKQKIVAESEAMQQVLKVALKLAGLEASDILILGDSGTGKGLLAKFIHENSKRKGRPLIQINCAALPESLLEAELFGYEKGAFTGARECGKVGLFELAHQGTLFLDEIGDLPPSIQAKLLKYLDDHTVRRLGGIKPKKVDCTIIAATNRDLDILRRNGRFRQDLFFRLNAFTLKIPPLRERPEDIIELANFFLRQYNKEYRSKKKISTEGCGKLLCYFYPGNVRELRNIIKNAVVMSEDTLLDKFIMKFLEKAAGKPATPGTEKNQQFSLTGEVLAVEKQILKDALQRCNSTREMACYLKISQATVVRKMQKHGLS